MVYDGGNGWASMTEGVLQTFAVAYKHAGGLLWIFSRANCTFSLVLQTAVNFQSIQLVQLIQPTFLFRMQFCRLFDVRLRGFSMPLSFRVRYVVLRGVP